VIPPRLVTTWIVGRGTDPFDDHHRLRFAHSLSSWLRVMPDYEIVILTRQSLDQGVLEVPPVVRRWLEDGHLIKVANWARVAYLLRHGGCYVDMDVEAVQRLDALRAREGCLLGHYGGGQDWANNAVILAEAGHPFLREWAALILLSDPVMTDLGNSSGPAILSRLLKRKGWDARDTEQAVRGGVTVLPHEYFYPFHWTTTYSPGCVTPETVLIHHWARSWMPPPETRDGA
jgi:hypothetical protein